MAKFAGRYDENLLSRRDDDIVKAVTSASVRVLETGTSTETTLYTDRTKSTTVAQPISPDSNGNLEFFANPGTYDVEISIDGTVRSTNSVVVQPDGAEALNAVEQVFNVLDYGAVADGSTDDTAAFQAAIDAAAAAGGGVVFVPAGSYALASVLTLDGQANVTILGAGWSATELICAGQFLNAINSSDQGTVEGLYVRCSTDPNTLDGIVVDQPKRWSVRRCFIEGFGNDSIRFKGGLHSTIEFNYFIAQDPGGANGNAGIRLTDTDLGVDGSTMLTRNNYVGAGNTYGIYIDNVVRSTYIGDIVENVATGFRFEAADGICIQPYAEAVTGNEFENDDATVIYVGHLSSEPVVSWTATAVEERVVPQLTRTKVQAKTGMFTRDGGGAEHAGVTIGNDDYNTVAANAALLFQHFGGNAGGKVVSDRQSTYVSAGSSDADLVLYAAENNVDVERLRLKFSGATVTSGELQITGNLNHDGSNVGFFGAAPVVQQTAPVALTDNSGGTTDNTVEAVSGSGADAAINNNFAELAEDIEAIRAALANLGLIA